MESMLSQFAQFHFIRPWFLLALIPATLLIILLWFRKPNYGAWHHIVSPHLLPHILQGTVKQQGKLPVVLLFLGWILASFALAGPTWSKLPQTVQKKINARVILLDLSLSMLAEDIKPSRLTRAQHKLKDILDQSEEGLTGLIVYAGTSHVVSPLTDDTHTILSMIMSLSPEIMPIKGSDPAAAVEKASTLLQQAGITEGQILLITDDLPADFVGQVKQFINPSLTPISVFAIGTNEGAPIPLSQGSFVKDASGAIIVPKLNTQRLKASASALEGRFSTLSSDDEDINYLLGIKNHLLNDELKDTERDFDTWNESGLILVLLLLPIAAMANRKGWLGMILMPSMLMLASPPPAEAAPWQDLWSTKDQQGQNAWKENNPTKAAELFENPEWKASAQYKSGDYESAANTLKQHVLTEQGNTADNQYNLGNALAQQQDLAGAADAYEKALSLDPDMQDAKSNQALVKKLLEEQQKQEGDGENKDGDDQENDEKENQDNKDQEKSDDENSDNSEEQDKQNQSEDSKDSDQQDPSKEQQEKEQQDKEEQSQQDQQQSETDEEEQKKAQQQQEEDESSDEQSEQQPSPQEIQESNLDKEEQQALEQWLRRIPDDPGGLLRRKFAQESKLRRNQPVEDKQW